jgi:hypothetical protein
VVSSVADDLRSNTLTNTVGIVAGGAGGAAKAANTGFTMASRQVGKKTVQGAAKGAAKGWLGSHVGAAVTGIANKVAAVEKWFDNTSVGKAIDSGITSVENLAHKAIGGGSY